MREPARLDDRHGPHLVKAVRTLSARSQIAVPARHEAAVAAPDQCSHHLFFSGSEPLARLLSPNPAAPRTRRAVDDGRYAAGNRLRSLLTLPDEGSNSLRRAFSLVSG